MLFYHLVISCLVFTAVFLLVWALFRFPAAVQPPSHLRIAAALGSKRRTIFENPIAAPLLAWALMLGRRFDFPGLRPRIQQDLDASGNPNGYSVEEYLALGLVCGAGAAAAALILTVTLRGRAMQVLLVISALVGCVAPFWSLRTGARARLRRISKQLPYTLDLIALMMEAGSTFTEAIETIVRDDPDDDFNQELRIVQAEIDFGVKRATALENLAHRIPNETVRSIVGAINQAERLGTALSTILMAQATMLRLHRSIRAERLAASASLYILIPTMLVLIATMVPLFGPMIVRWQLGQFPLS